MCFVSNEITLELTAQDTFLWKLFQGKTRFCILSILPKCQPDGQSWNDWNFCSTFSTWCLLWDFQLFVLLASSKTSETGFLVLAGYWNWQFIAKGNWCRWIQLSPMSSRIYFHRRSNHFANKPQHNIAFGMRWRMKKHSQLSQLVWLIAQRLFTKIL